LIRILAYSRPRLVGASPPRISPRHGHMVPSISEMIKMHIPILTAGTLWANRIWMESASHIKTKIPRTLIVSTDCDIWLGRLNASFANVASVRKRTGGYL
jgi:hypothetical protein